MITTTNLYYSAEAFNLFSPIHFLFLSIVGCVVLFFFLARDHFENTEKENMRYILIGCILAQQFLLYSWYAMNQQFNLIDALPLYPCRIFQILALFLLITKNKATYDILMLLGIPAAIAALLFAETNGLSFPNAMFIQFFVGHCMIIVVPMYMKYRYQMEVSRSIVKKVSTAIAIYFGAMLVVNGLIGSNYGYVSHPPVTLSILNDIPHWIYSIGYYSLYILIILIGSKLSSHFAHETLDIAQVVEETNTRPI